jgi:hypothetical protein
MEASVTAYVQRIKGRERVFVQKPGPAPAARRIDVREALSR